MFYSEINDKLYRFEESLNFLKQTGEIKKIQDDLLNFANFVGNNFFINGGGNDRRGDLTFKKELLNKNPEASKYLDDHFIKAFLRFNDELNKQNPNVEDTIREGVEILQRLRSFTKISSSSSY